MRGVIVYDTYYGNTRQVAEAIAAELEAEGHEAELRSVREHHPGPPRGDILFVGSPVRMGRATGHVKRFVRKLDAGDWRDKPVVAFTTILQAPENATEEQLASQDKWDRAAGRKLRDLAREHGIDAVEETLAVEVKGMKGPLVDSAAEQTRRFTREVLASARQPSYV